MFEISFTTATIICGAIGSLLTIYWMPRWLINTIKDNSPEVLFKYPSHDEEHPPIPDSVVEDVPKTIYLTFDDVPYKPVSYYLEIAKILDKYDMKATFFVISSFVNPEDEYTKTQLVKLVENGHLLGNHGSKNTRHIVEYYKSPAHAALDTEIDDCDALLSEIYQRVDNTNISEGGTTITTITTKKNKKSGINWRLAKNRFYRPGCGTYTAEMVEHVKRRHNYRTVLGTIHCFDPQVPFATLNYYYMINHPPEDGDIIILHDRSWTPSMLERYCEWLNKNDYKCEILH